MKKNWTIKLPDSVPPAISVPFTSIIPAFIAMYAVAAITYGFNLVTGQLIIDWIYDILQTPLLGFSQNPLSIILVAFLTQLFWFLESTVGMLWHRLWKVFLVLHYWRILKLSKKEQKYHIYGRVYHMVPLSGMQH